MEPATALYDFMDLVWEDPRIGPSHISLFIAMLVVLHNQEYKFPISVFSRELRKIAKISSKETYHKCINDLRDYGYIDYLPSYYPGKKSTIYLLKLSF